MRPAAEHSHKPHGQPRCRPAAAVLGDGCSLMISNNLIHNNSGVFGGGIDIYLNSTAVISNNTKQQLKNADVVIVPKLGDVSVLQYHSANQLIESGRKTTLDHVLVPAGAYPPCASDLRPADVSASPVGTVRRRTTGKQKA